MSSPPTPSSSSSSTVSEPIEDGEIQFIVEHNWPSRYTILDKIELEGREFPSDILLNDVFKNILEFSDAETHRNVFCTSKRTMSYYHHMGRRLFHNLDISLGITDLFHSHKKCSVWRVMLPSVENLKIDLCSTSTVTVPDDNVGFVGKYEKVRHSTKLERSYEWETSTCNGHRVPISTMGKLKELVVKGSVEELVEILSVCMNIASQLESLTLKPIGKIGLYFYGRLASLLNNFRNKCVNLKHFRCDYSLIGCDDIHNNVFVSELLRGFTSLEASLTHPKLESFEIYKQNANIIQTNMNIALPLKRFTLTTAMVHPGSTHTTFSQKFQEGLEYLHTTGGILDMYFEVAHLKNVRELYLEVNKWYPLQAGAIMSSVQVLTMVTNDPQLNILKHFPNLKHLVCKQYFSSLTGIEVSSEYNKLESMKLEACDLKLTNTSEIKNDVMAVNRYQIDLIKILLAIPSISLNNCYIVTAGINPKVIGEELPEDRAGLEVLYNELLYSELEFVTMMEAESKQQQQYEIELVESKED